jgi:acyl transferase domain-containing protein
MFMTRNQHNDPLDGIPIFDIAECFADAKNIEEFWQNLEDDIESILVFTDEEEIFEGIDLTTLSYDDYLKIRDKLENIDFFDTAFFSSNPKEAEATESQHHVFLERAWEALEN